MKIDHSSTPQRAAPSIGTLAIAALLLAGCANMSGLGGGTEYACKAPKGVRCDSVSGTYYNALQNNLPGQRRRGSAAATIDAKVSGAMSTPELATATAVGSSASKFGVANTTPPSIAADPLRSGARILRLWFKPWEDADHDLYDQGYVYVRIDDGHWLIEHAQQRIRDAFAPVRPPSPVAARAGGSGKTGDSGVSAARAPDNDSGALDPPFSAPPKPPAATNEQQSDAQP